MRVNKKRASEKKRERARASKRVRLCLRDREREAQRVSEEHVSEEEETTMSAKERFKQYPWHLYSAASLGPPLFPSPLAKR